MTERRLSWSDAVMMSTKEHINEEEEETSNSFHVTSFTHEDENKNNSDTMTEDSMNTVSTNDANASQPSQSTSDEPHVSYQYDIEDLTIAFTPNASLTNTSSSSNNNNNNNINTFTNNINFIWIKNKNMRNECGKGNATPKEFKWPQHLPPHILVVPNELIVERDNTSNENNELEAEQLYEEEHEEEQHNENKETKEWVENVKCESENGMINNNNINKDKVKWSVHTMLRRTRSTFINAKLVKLPHPRHGHLIYFLISVKEKFAANTDNSVINKSVSDNNEMRSNAECVVYELQAQRTASSFPLTWFVDNVVIPSRADYLYVATKFNISYFTLHLLLQSNKTCEAETLTSNNEEYSTWERREEKEMYKEKTKKNINNSNYGRQVYNVNSSDNCDDNNDNVYNTESEHYHSWESVESEKAIFEHYCPKNKETTEHRFVSKEELLNCTPLRELYNTGRSNQASCFYENYYNDNDNDNGVSNNNNENKHTNKSNSKNQYIFLCNTEHWQRPREIKWEELTKQDTILESLYEQITSHEQLAKFCDYKCVSFGTVIKSTDTSHINTANVSCEEGNITTNSKNNNNNNSDQVEVDVKNNECEWYYRFNKTKAIDWLVERIHRLECSNVLVELLHLSPVKQTNEVKSDNATIGHSTSNSNSNNSNNSNNNNNNIIDSDSKNNTISEEESNRRQKATQQCTEAAFQLVMEYVDKCLYREVALACNLPWAITNNNNSISNSNSCNYNNVKYATDENKENEFDYLSHKRQATEKEMQTRQRQSGMKSASVRRLEKAGKPSNTPTLFEMFASKAQKKK